MFSSEFVFKSSLMLSKWSVAAFLFPSHVNSLIFSSLCVYVFLVFLCAKFLFGLLLR